LFNSRNTTLSINISSVWPIKKGPEPPLEYAE
jgi:hypothetical protein